MDDPTAAGVPVLRKRLVVDLGTVEGVPGKIDVRSPTATRWRS
jgi:hypothetical protein